MIDWLTQRSFGEMLCLILVVAVAIGSVIQAAKGKW